MWFQYPEKLNKSSFRIFTLEPGKEGDGLQGSLQTHRLHTSCEYEALSYEWGNKTETRSMKCNNYDFRITQSLDIALRRLRLTNKPRSLWIDQICINQESELERSAQVSIMRLIYSNAAMVIAWLGQADTEATSSVKNFLSAFLKVGDHVHGAKHFPDNDHLARLNLPRRDSRVWKDLNLMLGVSYFSRVWIIQELASSSKYQLLWGDITISDKEFDSMRDRLVSLSMVITDATEDCPRIKWTPVPFKLNDTYYGLTVPYEDRWDDKDLFTLVQWASRSKATDQRDKIYALIGLSGQLHYNMEPDYSKSESEVFAEFATKVISTNKDLEILRHTHVEDPNEPKRSPLWAPRWQVDENTVGSVSGRHRASKETKAITKPPTHPNVLEVRGLTVDTVRVVHHRVPEVHHDIAAALEIVKSHNKSFEQVYGMDAIKVILLTMMTGWEVEVLHGPNLVRPEGDLYLYNFMAYAAIKLRQTMHLPGYDKQLLHLFQLAIEAKDSATRNEPHVGDSLVEHPLLDKIRRSYPGNPEYISPARDLIMILEHSKKTRGWYRFGAATALSEDLNFFMTEKGYVGVGPRCMKAGDNVCILFGGPTPYIIRPTSTTDEYLYLGSAYVQGVMDGEIIDAWEKDKDYGNQEFQEKFFKLL